MKIDIIKMGRTKSAKIVLLTVCFILIFIVGSPLSAMETIGVVKKVKGAALIERGEETIPINAGDKLLQGDTIVTTDGASVGIIFHDDGVLSMGPNTRLAVEEYEFNPAEKRLGMISRIFKGSAVYLTGLIAKLKTDSVLIKTPTATCGIRGTQIAIRVVDKKADCIF